MTNKKTIQNTLTKAILTLLSDVKDYSRLFDQYRQYLVGNDLSNHKQEATNSPSQATESLKELNNCLYRIVNDVINLNQILNLNREYSIEQINEANNNLIDLAGTSDSVNKRFYRLNNPNKLLVDIHKDFLENLSTLNTSIVEYNKDHENTLYLLSQALNIFNNNSPNLFK